MSGDARRHDIVAAAREIAPVAAEHAADADSSGRLDPKVVDRLLSAGFARHFVPASLGGDEGTFTDALEASAVLGEACVSTAWVASLMSGVGRMAAYLPAEGRARVWEKGPDTVIVGALMATGTTTRAANGYRLSGRWSYVSGVEFADWALVCGRLPDDTGAPAFFAVPRSEFRTEQTWDNVGMRATGSHSLVVDDVLVPAGHVFPLARLIAGEPDEGLAHCHSVPLKAVNGLALTGPILGGARGALRTWAGLLDAKLSGGVSGPVSGAVDPSHYEAILARAAGEIDAAGLLLRRCASVADDAVGAAPSPLETARAPRDCAIAADILAGTVDRLFRSSGSRGQTSGGGLQRLLRDVQCAAGHSGLQPAASARAFTQAYREAVVT
ncbi:acyl-CoA dehydrogenase family protein [Nocardiopsis halotolerans]|uniref:acyl-CoA dehydrogenase family protein n=1 Tax=Nocardiopsis halotolerans TaxID=124252 RepID=UPI00034A9A37|nr:acyl-CoA dehydrogenase family protein [Nocardiopsis halotolerans]